MTAPADRPYTLGPNLPALAIEDVWPSLYFGHERVAEIKRKAATLPWARRLVEQMRREAVTVLGTPPHVPVEPCGWRHDFFSRTTGAALLHEPDHPEAYLDPTTGKREADDAQRRAWALLTHERTYRLMRSLGVLYQVTGDERYAAWVADGLRQVAAYAGHAELKPKGILYFQSLYDAGAVLMLANAYGLTSQSSAYTAADHERIKAGFFEDRLPSLQQFLKGGGIHNIACFVAAAIARTGQLLGRDDLVQVGLEGPGGLHQQVLRGVPALGELVDGFWHEGTTFYHFYALCPLLNLAELERELTGKLTPEIERRLQAMLQAPLALADGRYRLPPLGDLGAPGRMSLPAYRHLYEYGAGRLAGDFGRPLAALYQAAGTERTEISALAYGPDELPPAAAPPRRSTLLGVAGIGVFRSGPPHDLYLLFRAGKHRAGHDHPDRLSIVLHAADELLSPDLGEPGYSLRSRHHNYFRATMAHNTVFVDEEDMTGSPSLDWHPEGRPPWARAWVSLEGTGLERTVFFDPPYIILLDRFQADRERRFGWVYHGPGPVELTPAHAEQPPASPALPPLPEKGVWANLADRHTAGALGAVAQWQAPSGLRLHLVTGSDGPLEVTAALAPGNSYPDRQGVLLLRAAGARRVIFTALELAKGGTTIKALTLPAEGTVQLTLQDGAIRRYAAARSPSP